MASRSILRAQVRTRSNTPVLCPHHKENKAMFVCLRQGCNAEFGCMECVATNHRGHEMEKLETYAAEKKIVLKDKVKAMKDDVLDSLIQKLKTTKNKITSNKTQTTEEQQKLFKHCNSLKNELDKIARKCAESCERTGEENDKKLKEHMECLESIYTKYKSELDKCEEVIKEGSDSDIILAERELPDTPVTPPFPDTDISMFKSGSFPSKNLEDLFGEVTPMVDATEIAYTMAKTDISNQLEVHDTSAPQAPAVDSDGLSQFQLKTDNIYVCGLLHPLKRKQLYIWFIKSNTVSVVTNDGKVTNTVTLQQLEDPEDYIENTCVSPVDETLWSISTKGKIQQVKQDGKQLNSIRYFVGREGKPKSLCVTRNQEVVVGVIVTSQVVILTTTGKVIRIINSKDIGLTSYPRSIIQYQITGRLAVGDLSRVSVVDEKYNHLYTIRGNRVTSPDGISRATGYQCEKKFDPWTTCFDCDGNLLVIDDNNCSVVMFSPSGQYIQMITKEKNRDNGPSRISITPDSTLWVAQRNFIFRQIKYN